MFDKGSGVHFEVSTEFSYAHGDAEQTAAVETLSTEFQARCSTVDTTTAFEEATQNQLAAMDATAIGRSSLWLSCSAKQQGSVQHCGVRALHLQRAW
ncbi:MAG: hypothetical protein ACJAZO_003933 [Myxococcota bacterium]|jgi:hypothetical protein